MTNEQRGALIALVEMAPTDPAFAREWLDRGGHYQTVQGCPIRQSILKRTLPLRYVINQQIAREEQRA